MDNIGSLAGITVIERSGRLAGGICAKFLADLGASVTRYVSSSDGKSAEDTPWSEHPFVLGEKRRTFRDTSKEDGEGSWPSLVGRADVVILTSSETDSDQSVTERLIHNIDQESTIICVVSAFGYKETDTPIDRPSETEMQALCGLMATTGSEGGPPTSIDAPVLELFAGINAATSVIGALRLMENGGRGQVLDIATFDTAFALLGTFIADVMNGKERGFRGGCLHPMLAPWNAYRTSDGWAILCSSSNAEWQRILNLIGRTELLEDDRFSDARARRTHTEEIDEVIGAWMSKRTTADAVQQLEKISVPISSLVSVDTFSEADTFTPCRRTPAAQPAPSPRPNREPGPSPATPLSGIRVIEVGPFTAGPLAGRLTANLGAEVIKVEPPGGEISRFWEPQRNGVGVYFANYNAGKRSVTLNLASEDGRDAFMSLIRSADVLIHNLKAGSMDKMGYSAEKLHEEQPTLVYCAISGYGRHGPATPALDMVIQAKAGLMSLIGTQDAPLKAGFSIADLIAAHFAPMEIAAALRTAQRTGEGQVLDISMYDSVAWLGRLGWPDVGYRLPETAVLETQDGWVLATGQRDNLCSGLNNHISKSMPTEMLLERLSRIGVPAVKIFELDEVLSLDIVRRRQLLRTVKNDTGGETTLISAPYGLQPSSLVHSGEVPNANADGDALVPRT